MALASAHPDYHICLHASEEDQRLPHSDAQVGLAWARTHWCRGRCTGPFCDAHLLTIEDTYHQVLSCNQSLDTLHITNTTGCPAAPCHCQGPHLHPDLLILVYSLLNKYVNQEANPGGAGACL